eukprot:TRINITY_DN9859_c0_g1_i1.p1 TRINITY_DN9859_c0_g1~~TRINITY_DN9859_c0_g1_i1.p1  ORF type:complete len:179 (+),score=21.92 TRINITY_DN9859_c0_g1_i1:72-608(+)
MGCTESKPEKKDLGIAPLKKQKSNANKEVWKPGTDFPLVLHNVRLQTPDRELKGIVITDCLVDNAMQNKIVDCTVRGASTTLINCHLINCKVDDGAQLIRCKLDSCKVRDATLTRSELIKCDNDKCTLADSCVSTGCTFGPVLTTTNSEYEDCKGNPFPPPESKLCRNCNWESDEPPH